MDLPGCLALASSSALTDAGVIERHSTGHLGGDDVLVLACRVLEGHATWGIMRFAAFAHQDADERWSCGPSLPPKTFSSTFSFLVGPSPPGCSAAPRRSRLLAQVFATRAHVLVRCGELTRAHGQVASASGRSGMRPGLRS
jgi:hypothetical protein